ncbi:MAG: nicotinate-nucleotide--dimethylbenzimidazole phosphoribosyltransferase [Anderseniella sp.]
MSRNENPGLLPFDDIRALLKDMPGFDEKAARVFVSDMHPRDVAGQSGQFAYWLAGWQGHMAARIRRPVVVLFAASHVTSIAASDELQVSDIMDLLGSIQNKTANVASMCARSDLGLKVFELAPEVPVADFTHEAAMEESDCAATIAYGMEATAEGCDLLIVRGLAAGGAASISALAAAVLGMASHSGDGQDTTTSMALNLHKSHLTSPLEILRRMGGREAAAVFGAITAARLQRVPVILDGALALVIAVLMERLHKGACDHCLVSALDDHPDCDRLLQALARPTILSGCYSHDDGTTGALATQVLVSALSISWSVREAESQP